jgi:pimeloyl-ACP methyl ester carboxylesterase
VELLDPQTSFVRAADAELRYFRSGDGMPLVLLHTLRTQLEYFRPLIERLDPSRLDVLAIDLPGHGRSSAPSVDYTADYFADAIERMLDQIDVRDAIVAGDSIGGTIALTLAARGNSRIAHVVAVNPYDYGRWSGIRRSSLVANLLFTAMLWPVIGPVIARSRNRWVLRHVLEGGLHDPNALPAELVDEMRDCGALPGHARAFRSLNQQWRTWVGAREGYANIKLPTTLVYGTDDWSHPDEREANARLIPGARTVSLESCGHFASLEKPEAIAQLIAEAAGI